MVDVDGGANSKGGRYALLIGSGQYHDQTLSSLHTPTSDVEELATALRDPAVGGFDAVLTLVNRTSAEVRKEIGKHFTQRRRGDMLLFYFSGHGILDDRGQLHLAAADTERGLLGATAISSGFIRDEMDQCRSQRQLLILDCCHGAAFARGAKSGSGVGTARSFEGNGFGRSVLAASDTTQFAWEGDNFVGSSRRSVFTHHLVEGLKSGAADLDGDGRITVDEIYEYVATKVREVSSRQTPCKWTYKQQGDLVLASARPTAQRPTTRPLPEQLKKGSVKSRAIIATILVAVGLAVTIFVNQIIARRATSEVVIVPDTTGGQRATTQQFDSQLEATRLSQLAERQMSTGLNAAASENFRQAYLLNGNAPLLRRVADALAAEGKTSEAVSAYRRFLQNSKDSIARSEVEQTMASLGTSQRPRPTKRRTTENAVKGIAPSGEEQRTTPPEPPAVTGGQLSRARTHWERGTIAYDLGRYEDAIAAFEQAYGVKNDPAFLYNLGQAHRLAGHKEEALRFYRTYLRYVPSASNRADIEQRIAELDRTSAPKNSDPTSP